MGNVFVGVKVTKARLSLHASGRPYKIYAKQYINKGMSILFLLKRWPFLFSFSFSPLWRLPSKETVIGSLFVSNSAEGQLLIASLC